MDRDTVQRGSGADVAVQESNAVSDREGTTFQKRERDVWNNKIDFLLALIGFSVGLGNVWRFPYLCFKYGGGAFLVPYLVCVVVAGVPFIYLEISLGQFMQLGGIKVWDIMPILKGIGFATTIIVFLLDCYYNVILAWAFYYVFSSFTSELPWSSCNNTWNTEKCRTVFGNNTNGSVFTDPATEYWNNKVLGIDQSDGVHDPVGIKWDICLCLLLAWIVVFLCICKGIKTSGKIMYFTATSPYILMIILLIRGCTLPGALEGIKFYVLPNASRMLHTQVWVAAGTQIFFSYSIGLGTLTALGSYNRYSHNSYRDAYLFTIANSGTSILAGFVIFPVLGFMAQRLNVPIDKVAQAGPGLAFIAYPQALAQMPIAPLWSVVFFIMVILLGLDSQFVGVEGLVTAISDIFSEELKKGYRKILFVAGICCVCFLIGLSMVTYGGMYVFQMFDHYSGSRVILLVAFFEVTGIAWLYGIGRIYDNIEHMLGFRISPYMGFSWLVSGPTFCLVMFGFVLSKYEELTYGDYEYPQEAIAIAWVVACISIMMIPIYLVYKTIAVYRVERNISKVFKILTTPQIPTVGLTDEELAQRDTVNLEPKYDKHEGTYAGEDNLTFNPPTYSAVVGPSAGVTLSDENVITRTRL